MKVSVIIKALNEERNIVRSLESALKAIERIGSGEVIVADSLSTDRTVELASRYPVRIVQLVDAADRSCGVGAELGYQIARGEYIYILDADMELDVDFLSAAVTVLDSDPSLGAVGGIIQDMLVVNAEFRKRADEAMRNSKLGVVDRLDGGGLFRRTAIDQIQYLTNRNLHGYEEYELALRLRTAGWRLIRLDQLAAKHYGHTDSTFGLLWRRWRSRYVWAAGELLRECVHKPYRLEPLKGIAQYRLAAIVFAWWATVLLALSAFLQRPDNWMLLLLLVAAPLGLGLLRKQSLLDAWYMVVLQNVATAGLLAGILAPRRGDPAVPPEFRLIK